MTILSTHTANFLAVSACANRGCLNRKGKNLPLERFIFQAPPGAAAVKKYKAQALYYYTII